MSQQRNERAYCSDLCLASGEPMLGTAAQVDVWLLLEYRGTWRRKAIEDNDLDAATRRWLEQAVAAYAADGRKARAQFIRQPESSGAEPTLFVAKDGQLLRRRCSSYRALDGLDVRAANFDEVQAPHYFVCTNGQRDLCCARYGLPTYAKLRDALGERVWQTTHVGGHRFAPNVLVLPQGALYGRVFADEAERFADAVEGGELCVAHLRGRAAYPPEAQVAECRLNDSATLKAVNDGEVVFETASGDPRTINVQRAATPLQVVASCGKSETEAVFPFL